MQRTHKIRLYPNNKQATYLARSCGVARFAYNWGLDTWNKMYELHKSAPEENPTPNQYILRKKLNSIKRDSFPWMLEVTKYAPQQALINLGKGFDNFFRKKSQSPVFKKKGVKDSFYIGADVFKIKGDKVWIPGLSRFLGGRKECGWIRTAESLRFTDAKIVSATVSRTADEWYVSIACEVDAPETFLSKKHCSIGIDVGVGEYVTSEGEFFTVPRAYRYSLPKMRRAQRSLSRKCKGSKNRLRQIQRVARLHKRISNVRSDWLHKISTQLTKKYNIIALEDLNVKGMVRNHHLALSVSDASFGEFRKQIEYKAKDNGCKIVFIDRWYPSSKTCSRCGKVKAKLPLSERVYKCDECGLVCHRDLNAAINLNNFAASSAVSACGEFNTSVRSDSRSASSLNEAGSKHHSKSLD